MNDLSPSATLRLLIDSLNRRDVTPLKPLIDEQAVFFFPGAKPVAGAERMCRFFEILFYRFPRLVFTVGRVVGDDRCAAAEWTNEGEDRRGAPYANQGVTFLELAAGRIVYLSDTFKDTSFTAR